MCACASSSALAGTWLNLNHIHNIPSLQGMWQKQVCSKQKCSPPSFAAIHKQEITSVLHLYCFADNKYIGGKEYNSPMLVECLTTGVNHIG